MFDMNNIKNEDCIKYLKSLGDKSVDLILTDPPYDISRDSGFKNGGGVKRFQTISMDFGEWDHGVVDMDATIKECYRVLKNSATIIIFYDLWKITELSDTLKKYKFNQLRFIEWIKTNPVPINSKINYLTNSREIAVLAVKGTKPTFNSSYDNGVYEFPIYHSKDRIHPTQKPPELFEMLIKKHSNEGDVVLDPFLGSGTTVVASLKCGRIPCGCELDSDMFEKMIRRIENGTS
jgi:site-specific DNA-methyltransferase (adenine-specific)